jgi:hypothetical protein
VAVVMGIAVPHEEMEIAARGKATTKTDTSI